MTDFAYHARDADGRKITGTLSAATRNEAVSILTGRALFPVEVTADKPAMSMPLMRRVSGQLMATTYGQLAGLLRSGVPMLRSISVLQKLTSNKVLREVLRDVGNRVEDGASLADAMARHGNVFSEMAVSMARAGSEGGFLEDALDGVADFTEQQEDLKSRTIGALAYPVFLIVVGTIVVTSLIIFFVPSFDEIFSHLRERGELPVFTEILLWLSTALRRYFLVFLAALVLVFAYLRKKLSTPQGRRMRDLVKLRLPLVGKVYQSLAVVRFCRVLGTLLHSGVPIIRSLEISREAAGNRILSEAIAEASQNISAGQSLAVPLGKCKYFPANVVEMIAVAEESNHLEQVLTQIAESMQRRTIRQLDLAVRLLEPILLLILAGFVLFIVTALLLPVLKMSSTI